MATKAKRYLGEVNHRLHENWNNIWCQAIILTDILLLHTHTHAKQNWNDDIGMGNWTIQTFEQVINNKNV